MVDSSTNSVKSDPVHTSDKSVLIGVVSTIVTFTIIGVTIFVLMMPNSDDAAYKNEVVEIDWRKMQELDVKTKAAPDWFKNLNGKLVKLPGYAVPLDDNMKEIREFIMVPDAMSCIHVPPPPANMTVYVKMTEPIVYNSYQRAVWITGQLLIEDTKSEKANAAWKIKGVKMAPYEFED